MIKFSIFPHPQSLIFLLTLDSSSIFLADRNVTTYTLEKIDYIENPKDFADFIKF